MGVCARRSAAVPVVVQAFSLLDARASPAA
jgi:hypothetical protein